MTERSEPAPTESAGRSAVRTGPGSDAELARECEVFARYLVGELPTRYAVRKYLDAHEARPDDLRASADTFDRRVVRLARRGPGWTWLADCHARVWAPEAVLRSKLVLLVSILESCPPSSRAFRRERPERTSRVLARLAWRGGMFVGGVLLSSLLLGGMGLATGIAGASGGNGPPRNGGGSPPTPAPGSERQRRDPRSRPGASDDA